MVRDARMAELKKGGSHCAATASSLAVPPVLVPHPPAPHPSIPWQCARLVVEHNGACLVPMLVQRCWRRPLSRPTLRTTRRTWMRFGTKSPCTPTRSDDALGTEWAASRSGTTSASASHLISCSRFLRFVHCRSPFVAIHPAADSRALGHGARLPHSCFPTSSCRGSWGRCRGQVWWQEEGEGCSRWGWQCWPRRGWHGSWWTLWLCCRPTEELRVQRVPAWGRCRQHSGGCLEGACGGHILLGLDRVPPRARVSFMWVSLSRVADPCVGAGCGNVDCRPSAVATTAQAWAMEPQEQEPQEQVQL